MIIVVGTGPTEVADTTQGLAVSLVGVDGSTWDLVNGPVRMTPGVAGLSGPDPEHWWRDSPALDGSYHAGQRTPRGEVTLPVRIRGTTSLEWRNLNAEFMRAVDPSGECSLLVTAPQGNTRSLGIRLLRGMSPAYPIDPSLLMFSAHDLDFAAAYPFWREGVSESVFTGPAALNIAGGGITYVTNPGDVAVYPRWTIAGPCTAAQVGVITDDSDRRVVLNNTMTSTDLRIIDTNPFSQTVAVTDGAGVDKWANVTRREFAPIPPGSTARLVHSVTQPTTVSSVRVEFTPAYRQPW